MKRHYIFASHGSFANGLLNSVELILGKQPDIHTLCAYVEEEVDLTQQVEALVARFPGKRYISMPSRCWKRRDRQWIPQAVAKRSPRES